MDIGLWYPKGDNFELIGFLNADYADYKVERKSSSGTCHFLGYSLVSWHSVDPQFCPSTLAFILRASHLPIIRIWHH